ncbi:MAG: peptidase M3, partial [Lachnospiraceae bacterium]|nr:peptidase M3 [Lachnospiraceae bacterium]
MYDKWSLEVLYSDFQDERFQNDVNKLDTLIAEFHALTSEITTKNAKISTDIETTKNNLIQILQLTEQFTETSARLINYCALRQSANTSDTESVSYIGRLIQKTNEITKDSTLLNKYIANIEHLEAIIESDAFLTEYKDYLLRIKDADKYLLNEQVEDALSRMDLSGGQAWSDLQGFLTSSVKVDYNGEETTLSAIRNMAYSPDANIRKTAYEAELASYEKIKDAVAYSLNSIKMQAI